jgi:hypothetical protein
MIAKQSTALTFTLLLSCIPHTVQAFGGRPAPAPAPTPPPAPTQQQAKPFRLAAMAPITVPAFYFANGVRADFNSDLNALVESEINQSRFIRTQAIPEGQGGPDLIISGGVTSFEMDVLQFNFKIGWNPGGVIGLPGSCTIGFIDQCASGEVDLRLSALSMDFKIFDRRNKVVYLSNFTDENISKLKVAVRVNLAAIQSSLDVFYKTKISESMRTATRDVMRRLENDRNFDLLPWNARILGVDNERSLAIIGAGSRGGVKVGDVYSIYSSCDSAEIQSCVRRFLADVRIVRAGQTSSEATLMEGSLNRIQPGDDVEVKAFLSTTRR